MALEDTYGGENAGALRRWSEKLRTMSKGLRLIPFPFAESIFGFATSPISSFLSKATGFEFMLSIGAGALNGLAHIGILLDNVVNGDFRKAINEAVAGTVEFSIETLRSMPFTGPLLHITQPVADVVSKVTTGKIISTNVYDAVEDVMDRINPPSNNNDILKNQMPGINMASLSTNQAALAMAPAMATVQPQMRAQPAPGYAPTYWTDRRAAELGMAPEQLAQRQGVGELNAARDARMAELAQEQAV